MKHFIFLLLPVLLVSKTLEKDAVDQFYNQADQIFKIVKYPLPDLMASYWTSESKWESREIGVELRVLSKKGSVHYIIALTDQTDGSPTQKTSGILLESDIDKILNAVPELSTQSDSEGLTDYEYNIENKYLTDNGFEFGYLLQKSELWDSDLLKYVEGEPALYWFVNLNSNRAFFFLDDETAIETLLKRAKAKIKEIKGR